MASWESQAADAAAHAHDEMFQDHRGVMKWRTVTAIFGNDGYRQDELTRVQVDILRQFLVEAAVAERAFAPDERKQIAGQAIEPAERGYSWAMLVQSDDLDWLHRAVWEAYRIAQGCAQDDSWYRAFRNVQGGDIADY